MNLIAMKKNFIVVLASFTAIVITMLCFFGYRTAIADKMNHIIDTKSSKCYLSLSYDVPSSGLYKQISTRYVRYYWPTKLTPDSIDLLVEGKTYSGHDKFNYKFGVDPSDEPFMRKIEFKTPFDICAVLKDNDDVFPEMMITEMQAKTTSNNPVKYGEADLNVGKIMVSDFMLENFGLSDEDQKLLVGKKISFVNKETGFIYCNDLELCGIIDSNLFYIDSLVDAGAPQILIAESDMCMPMAEDMAKYLNNENAYKYDDPDFYDGSCVGNLVRSCYMSSFSDYKQLIIQMENDGFFAWPSYETEMFYVISQQKLIIDYVVSVIIGVFSITLMSYLMTALYFYYKRNYKYKQMLRAIGINMKDVFAISLVELSGCALVSVIIGTILSFVFAMIFNAFWSRTAYVEISFSVSFFVVIPALILLTFLLFCFIAVSVSCINLNRNELSTALNEE
ncbi:MAG: ABC transporter permease [Saccharofermentans sp.]|nr:ABC transporter permease [Saccharofermentans sp.]